MLSESPSPAPGPCGMPFLVEPADVEELAGGVAAVEDCVDGLAAGVDDVDELDALEPHAASPSAASTSRPAASRRADLGIEVVMVTPLCRVR